MGGFSFKQAAHNRYEQKVHTIAHQLRSMADEVEREGLFIDGKTYSTLSPHLYATERVLHTLAWGFANLGAHYLMDAAADADQIEDDPVPEPEPF